MSDDSRLRLRLPDLVMLDARELQRLLPEGSYTVEQETLHRHEHGDLGLTAAIVVLVAPPVIQAIAAWLLKKRQRQSIILTFEKVGANNSILRSTIEIQLSKSEAPEADVVKQIVSGMKLDPALVAQVIGGSTNTV